jgi:hypothetical protein
MFLLVKFACHIGSEFRKVPEVADSSRALLVNPDSPKVL